MGAGASYKLALETTHSATPPAEDLSFEGTGARGLQDDAGDVEFDATIPLSPPCRKPEA